MPTSNQLSSGASRKPMSSTSALSAFGRAPHSSGIVYQLAMVTPRKPNSARRKMAKVLLCHNNKRVFTQIPGLGHQLHKHSAVMVEGGGAKDLPGVSFSLMRGLLDFVDLEVHGRKNSSSKYGVKSDADE